MEGLVYLVEGYDGQSTSWISRLVAEAMEEEDTIKE